MLVCDMRQASLFAGLRDLLWFLLDIAFTNTGWSQEGQQAPEYASGHQRGEATQKTEKNKTKPPALAPLRASQAASELVMPSRSTRTALYQRTLIGTSSRCTDSSPSPEHQPVETHDCLLLHRLFVFAFDFFPFRVFSRF